MCPAHFLAPMFVMVLFVIASNWKQPKYSPTGGELTCGLLIQWNICSNETEWTVTYNMVEYQTHSAEPRKQVQKSVLHFTVLYAFQNSTNGCESRVIGVACDIGW